MGKELAQYALHGTVTGVDECMGDVDITGGIRGIVRITWDKHTMDLIPKEKVMELSAEKQRTLTREIAEACIKEHGVVLQAVAVAETAALMGKDDHTSADELRENMTKSQDQKREQDIKREHDAALTLLERHDIAVMTSEEMNSLKLVQQNKGWSLLNALHIGNAETVELFEPELSEEYVDAMEHITKHGIDLRADVPEKYTVEYKVCTCHIPFTAAKRGCSFQCTHFRRTTQTNESQLCTSCCSNVPVAPSHALNRALPLPLQVAPSTNRQKLSVALSIITGATEVDDSEEEEDMEME